MHQEKYSLTWHNYSDHLKNMMKEMMMNEDFSDVTLVTEDKKHIKANCNILSTCSPVFKDMLKQDRNSNPIIYLRGIQHSEMESIIQFIHLGEAKLHKDRMDEFLAVAKSLEIKELCNAKTQSIDELVEEPFSFDPAKPIEILKGETVISDQIKMETPQERQKVVGDGRHVCDQCHKTYSGKGELNRHKQALHQGVKYACDQCDYQATQSNNLTKHHQIKHEGVKYACDQCDYRANCKESLNLHSQSIHEGLMYTCDQCDYTSKFQGNLTRHIQSKHEGGRK